MAKILLPGSGIRLLSTASPWDLNLFKLTLPLPVSTVQLLHIIKEKGCRPDRKPDPLPHGLRKPYRNLKSEYSQYYAQKRPQNWTFMNSAPGPRQLYYRQLMQLSICLHGGVVKVKMMSTCLTCQALWATIQIRGYTTVESPLSTPGPIVMKKTMSPCSIWQGLWATAQERKCFSVHNRGNWSLLS